MRDKEEEARIVNEAHAQICQQFKDQVESVVTVVLFKSDNDQRTFHIAQAVSDDAKDSPTELFCESAGRLGMQARQIVANRGRS
jgi:hypothetical protein